MSRPHGSSDKTKASTELLKCVSRTSHISFQSLSSLLVLTARTWLQLKLPKQMFKAACLHSQGQTWGQLSQPHSERAWSGTWGPQAERKKGKPLMGGRMCNRLSGSGSWLALVNPEAVGMVQCGTLLSKRLSAVQEDTMAVQIMVAKASAYDGVQK